MEINRTRSETLAGYRKPLFRRSSSFRLLQVAATPYCADFNLLKKFLLKKKPTEAGKKLRKIEEKKLPMSKNRKKKG